MSKTSSSEAYSENSDNESTTPTHESPSGENSVVELSGRHLAKESQRQDQGHYKTEDFSTVKVDKDRHEKRNKSNMKEYLSKQYRDLLNSEIANSSVEQGTEASVSSQVGASLWTSTEKEAFFSALASHGTENLCAISSAIGTKSEPEVRLYSLVLQDHGADIDSRPSSSSGFTAALPPAAFEIDDHCANTLGRAAEALSELVFQRDMVHEQRTSGKYWLIDEAVADEIEKSVEQAELLSATKPTADNDDGRSSFDYQASKRNPGKGLGVEVEDKANASPDPHSPSPSESWVLSAELLKPCSLLQLSSNLFMNSAREGDDNWHTINSGDSVVLGPALFRTALDDLYDIVVNVTRRLVQATIFQATTRLRARDESFPAAVVTESDATIACELLRAQPENYWTTVAQRCGVDVYSDSDAYQDGRPRTKIGRKLSPEEVQLELGFASPTEQDAQRGNVRPANRSDIEEMSQAPSSGGSGRDSESDPSEGERSSDDDTRSRTSNTTEHSSVSPDPETEEDNYLDFLDQQASQEEQQKLLNLLGHSESPEATPELLAEARFRQPKRRVYNDSTQWRKRVKYTAEWERHAVQAAQLKQALKGSSCGSCTSKATY